ncbi:MarR family winged helix-turn-helix transcriptional regulator [Romboutsia lituseburensis]|uniref:DNA-binding transcriptional regulator, MarR family n=1 Tax=Romboutsia lituseburensis DSM 797 TaxID=1121325 RepID=A0A1G9ICA2_9FIRM|nr:MarR family transcriptional regulator [Romboutsia lituseburensis]SDL22837.1 DNA-binding transcriptional regulator, MarR family [Romboutsia lituseburensis DSM 797]
MEKLTNDILREIGSLSRAIHSISDIKYKELKLQKGQFTFLTRICENPGINFIDLSNMLKVDKTTTTKVVQKLIKVGYVDKIQDETDKRGYNLFPTQKSIEVYDLIIKEENRNIEVCLDKFTESEKMVINQLVKRMSKNIETDWKNKKSKKESFK